jgi:hypothetical protein
LTFYDAARDQGFWRSRNSQRAIYGNALMMPPGSRMGPGRLARARIVMRRTCGTTLTMMEMTMAGRPVTDTVVARAMVTEGMSRPGFEAIFDLRDGFAAHRDEN